MILRSITRCVLLCVAYGGLAAAIVAYGQENGSPAEADQEFQQALKVWGDGKSAEAETLLNHALAIRQEQLGPNDPKVAQVIERLGALAFNRGKYADAEVQFRKALDIDRKALGEKSLEAAYFMGDLGAAIREQGRYSEAQAIVEHSLALRRERLPPNDLGIAGSLNNLGRVYFDEHRYSDARQAFEESLRIYETSLPSNNPRVVEAQDLLTRVQATEAKERRFVKVFDVGDAGYRDWIFPAFGLIFVVIGAIIFAFPNIIKATRIPYFNFKSKLSAFFRYSVVGFAVLWTAVAFWGTYAEHLRHEKLVKENRCRVVEGPVEHFVPMPVTGHATESFTVAGVPFSYSDFIVTDGFNNTAAYGGPINSNSYVRICYDPNGNGILRLEILDFTGDQKNYGTGLQTFFPIPRDSQNVLVPNPQVNIPWYSNLFIVLYILDFVAIQILFVPYLKTFFRVATTVRNSLISMPIEASTKIKLRNSLIFWNAETQTIWLRPRGFNRIRIPLVVAALKLDAQGKSIIEDQIRFSSGFPFVTLLFFWTAYQFFSATMPSANDMPSAALFVGIAALFFLIVGFINLRIHRSRMEALVEDALTELCAEG